MENKKKSVLAGSLIATAMLGVSALNVNATQLFSFNELGTGSEVRSTLLERATSSANIYMLEHACGSDKKDGKAKDDKKVEGKAKDGKCGEGKCGDKKKEKEVKKEEKKK